MNNIRNRLGMAALLILAAAAPMTMVQPAAAQEIRQVVNGSVVTSSDVQRRQAFLRLQQQGAGAQAAQNQMVEQVLRAQEMERLRIRIGDQQINEAYERFASSNSLTTNQLDQILSESGVTRDHFREFMRVQMGWGQALQARAAAERGSAGNESAIRDLARQGGTKPSTTEYILQQFIFVVPQRERGSIMSRRRGEAQAMRQRVSGCDASRDLARSVLDVTVRDLGRVLEPELPPDWESQVKAVNPGQPTAIRDTDRGVEFLVICSARQVNDDRAAALVLESREAQQGGDPAEALNEKYMAELRERAQISAR